MKKVVLLFVILTLAVHGESTDIISQKLQSFSKKEHSDIIVNDWQHDKFKFEGRWLDKSEHNPDPSKGDNLHFSADWPCSGFSFNIETEKSDTDPTVKIKYQMTRARVLITVEETQTSKVVHQEIVVGEDIDIVDLR